MQLIINNVYAVESDYETYIGTYRGEISNKYYPPYKNLLWNVQVRIKQKTNRKPEPILVKFVSINKNDIVYDLNKIKQSAKKAKESFEKRCLDKILKGLINEEFQW